MLFSASSLQQSKPLFHVVRGEVMSNLEEKLERFIDSAEKRLSDIELQHSASGHISEDFYVPPNTGHGSRR